MLLLMLQMGLEALCILAVPPCSYVVCIHAHADAFSSRLAFHFRFYLFLFYDLKIKIRRSSSDTLSHTLAVVSPTCVSCVVANRWYWAVGQLTHRSCWCCLGSAQQTTCRDTTFLWSIICRVSAATFRTTSKCLSSIGALSRWRYIVIRYQPASLSLCQIACYNSLADLYWKFAYIHTYYYYIYYNRLTATFPGQPGARFTKYPTIYRTRIFIVRSTYDSEMFCKLDVRRESFVTSAFSKIILDIL